MLKLFRNALRLGVSVGGAVFVLNNAAIATEEIASEVNLYPAITTAVENPVSTSNDTAVVVTAEPTLESTHNKTEAKFSESLVSEPASDIQIKTVAQSLKNNEQNYLAQTQQFNPNQNLSPSSGVPSSNPIIERQTEITSEDAMGQVTSVYQLRDVQPTDWAFQALQTIVERYGCIAGYPDGTFRGNQALTRYEFAAGLNACLQRVSQLIQTQQTGTNSSTNQADLATLQRLRSEFATELATISQRVDNLESTINRIAQQRFSTTTVLNGEILMAVSGLGGDRTNGDPIGGNVVFSHRTELNLSTSFFGTDVLRTRLAASNNPDFATITGTNFSRLSFTGSNNNNIDLSALFYRFPVGKQATVLIGAQGIGFGDFAPTLNPYINSSLLGNVGNFSGESAIYALNGGRGVGLEYRFSRAVRLSLGYLAAQANNPTTGIFNNPYGAIAQVTLLPTDNLTVGLTYVRSYNIIGTGKGSQFAENPFDGADTSTNTYGVEASYQVSPNFNVSGWAGLINAQAESNPYQGSNANIFTWALTFAFPDLGGLGNLAGFIIGQPPKVTSNDVAGRTDLGTSLHLETFYRYQLTDNIAITPGLFMITNPEHNNNNDPIFVGTLRTSFVF